MSESHLIKDETLGGVLREYVEVDQEAKVGDKVTYVYDGERDGKVVTVTKVATNGDIYFDNQLENHIYTDTCGFTRDAYRVLEPTDIVQIDGHRYKLAERKAKVGEKVLIVDDYVGHGFNIGSVQVINEIDYGNYAMSGDYYLEDDDNCDYLVLEPVEATPEVTDLLANLARRVASLESQLADTQRNVERQAEELENKTVNNAITTQDNVNSPSHYMQGRFETIDVIEDISKGYDDGFVSYCVGSATKYLYRAPFKHETPVEDLRKAAKYLAFAIDYLTKGDQ